MSHTSRRDFLKTAAAGTTAAVIPYWFTSTQPALAGFSSALERPVIGCIGTGSRWGQVVPKQGKGEGKVAQGAIEFGPVAACCDVDAGHLGKAVERCQKDQGTEQKIDAYEDYRKILDRSDIDVVTIVTPDHWHSKIAIEAMQAGKHVYCEKPLTLTIEEGKQICEVARKTGRVFQVGTQQRTEFNRNFLKAMALIRNDRIGQLKTVTAAIGTVAASKPLPVVDAPKELNWEMWLGQAPLVDFRAGPPPASPKERQQTRGHYEFRWWYEYSGGKLTDWGAHHVDISMWAMDQIGDGQGPSSLKALEAKHLVPLKDGMPTQDDRYNVAGSFNVEVKFDNGMVLYIRDEAADLGFKNGIMFEGTNGRFFVSREKITGKPVEDLETNPLPEDAIAKIYGGKEPTSHMANFMECLKSGDLPISDVFTHHRAMTTCHLANIAIRLGREIKWDPVAEHIVGDPLAMSFESREQRKGYEIKV